VTDFLDEKHKEITERLKELKPLVDEFNRLEAAASALAKVIGSAASEATSAVAATVTHRRRRGRPRRSKATVTPARMPASPESASAKPVAKRKTQGRKRSGKRARQALALIRANPGISVSEMAKKMGIDGTYLYKVLPPLEREGKIRKEGRGWFLKDW
jgi:ribosomal protein S25